MDRINIPLTHLKDNLNTTSDTVTNNSTIQL